MSMALRSTHFNPALDTPTEITYKILYEDAERTRKRSDTEIARLYLKHVHSHCVWLEKNYPLDDDPYLLYRCEQDALERVMAQHSHMEWGAV